MHYKTIILELLQDQYPALHERLRQHRALLQAMNDYSACLKRYHESWMDRLSMKRPDSDPMAIASEALELALLDLREEFSYSGSMPNDPTDDPLSLDAAMDFVRTHTPPA